MFLTDLIERGDMSPGEYVSFKCSNGILAQAYADINKSWLRSIGEILAIVRKRSSLICDGRMRYWWRLDEYKIVCDKCGDVYDFGVRL